ncbi:TolC family protein [bacterium]|nr:TolC family protein [bacterium]
MSNCAFAITDKKVKEKKKETPKVTAVKNKFEYINIEWWAKFNDENLNKYIQLAVNNNYDLKMATNVVEEYYQSIKIQRAHELPQVSAGFAPAFVSSRSFEQMRMNRNNSLFAVPVIVSYEADIFLKNPDKTKSAKKTYEISLTDERASYISIVSAVGSLYFNIVKLNKLIETQETIVNCRKEISDLMDLSNKEGLVSTFETVRANESYILGNTHLTEYKKQREYLLNKLAVLIGASPEEAESLEITPYDDISFDGIIPDEISSEIITKRPDYIRSEKMLEKAGIDVRVARKEFLPTIPIFGAMVFNAGKLGSLFTTSNMLWAAGGNVLASLYTGGAKKANLKIKKAEFERVLNNYKKTNLTAIQEVNDALASVKYDTKKLDDNLQNIELETKAFELTKLKYDEGVASRLDLMQREENLMNINQMLVNEKMNCYLDYISLYKATGAGI